MAQTKIYFVHMNKKASSKDAVRSYLKNAKGRKKAADQLSGITEKMLNAKSVSSFCTLMDEHELILSEVLSLPPVKQEHFSDFNGSIKSLGAWGGDFVMVCTQESESAVRAYFESKSYPTVISYNNMVLSDIPVEKLTEV